MDPGLSSLLESAQTRLREQHLAGSPGDQTARDFALAIDEVVRAQFRTALAQLPGEPLAVALVAVGGYGRAELCPYSDLDLWFLVGRGGAGDPRAAALAEAVLYPLWDLRLEVGHAVRTIEDTLALAREDLTACTALLDARFVDGDRALFDELERAVPRLFERDLNAFVDRVTGEKDERHARFGDTVYLLEPNVKNGEGGYRDLLVGLWAVKARFRVHDLPELIQRGQASARQVEALVEARRFYLQVRTAAHLQARRKADRLTFELQEAIAPRLFPAPAPQAGAVRPAVAPSVEALMQQYFLHAKAVKRETERLLERCHVEPPRRPRVRALDASFALFNGKLSTRDPEVFRSRPSEMMRIFNVALETGAEIYGHTRDLIADAVAGSREAVAADPRSGIELMRLIADDRDQRSPSLLEQAHDLGLLGAIMPEFQPCTGRVQHDLYHVFTVDQHSLYAVARLKEIARGELAATLPVATQAMREVRRRAPLYLGTLLHDVGKPLGKGHSETGARLAVGVARRLGLDEEDVSQTEFLVRRHLVLSHLSQRRDLDDLAMIANLAAELSDEETLRELYLLTLADMSMVAPGNLSDWKEQLLRELFARTLGYFRRGPDLAGPNGERRQVVARRKRRAAELLGEPEVALEPWFASLPERYVAITPPRQIAAHVRLSRRRAGPVATEVIHRPRRGMSELTVCAEDAPGLLARIAGVLLANRIDVLGAQIHSRSPVDGSPAARAEALDVFVTRDPHGRALTDPARFARVEEDLGRVLSGALDVEALIAERRERSRLPERVVPAVPTEVEVDNEVSADFSVIDVFTQDRVGVLYAITRTLAGLALDIRLSKVATEAARVADVFYVREQGGGGKLGAERVAELKRALSTALASIP